ncbi:MAG: hypothetical protein KGY67_00685 [Candidatus Thermoplasmatota archaeon]|nr:hypothetical protein [Candidatus Thermoplasmatota archaeon]
MRDEEFLKQEVDRIIEEQTHYGTVPIEQRVINDNVIWIGTNGYSDSIGQWIRIVHQCLSNGDFIYTGFKWQLPVGCNQTLWYFGVQLGRQDDKTFYCCGGATDFSGEGNHARELANSFLERITGNIYINHADFLISLLTLEEKIE